MCAEKQHKYTVVLTGRDGVYTPKTLHVTAYNPDSAEKIAMKQCKDQWRKYVAIAIFHGHLEAL